MEEDQLLSGILTQLTATGTALGQLIELINSQSSQSSERHALIFTKLEQLQTEGQARSERVGALETALERIAAKEEMEAALVRERSSWARQQAAALLGMAKQPVLWIITGGAVAGGYNLDGCQPISVEEPSHEESKQEKKAERKARRGTDTMEKKENPE